MAFVEAVVGCHPRHATGNLHPASDNIEATLAGLLPIFISLAANWLGLGSLPAKVKEIVAECRGRVDKALDQRIVNEGPDSSLPTGSPSTLGHERVRDQRAVHLRPRQGQP